MKNVRIHVMPDDIAGGKRGHGGECPVARAIKRYLPGQGVCVLGSALILNNNSARFPRWVSARIEKYDFEGKMTPFEFDIEVPDDTEVRY